MEFLLHDRDLVLTPKPKRDVHSEDTNPEVSVNSAKTTFTGFNPNHFNFDHIICDRGYFDKDDFIQTHANGKNTQTDELNQYSVIDSSQLYFTDHNDHQFTLPPDHIQCRSEFVSKATIPTISSKPTSSSN